MSSRDMMLTFLRTQPLPSVGATIKKLAASAALAACLVTALPAMALLDMDTSKVGESATIEASHIGDETPAAVVAKLQKMLPEIQARLAEDAASNGSGSGYPDSIVKELDTVKSEIDALQRGVDGNSGADSVKSTASGIEQQMNALKAMLGFD